MLAKTDTPIEQFFPLFAQTGVPVAFLVPTSTGFAKSIMDATGPVRELLRSAGVHDFDRQRQGPAAKVMWESYFVHPDGLQRTDASLYRPVTKKGDPRIWFSKLTHYCRPYNLLALIVVGGCIYVMNLSDVSIAESLRNRGFVYDLLIEAARQEDQVAQELLGKLQSIHDRGFLPSVTPGDPGVGDTLEDALGIRRNNAKTPDYKGIELKTTRLTRNGTRRATTRVTIFTKVPHEGMTYRQILDAYGKMQVPRGETEARWQLYETCRASRPNAYDLLLAVENGGERLHLLHQEGRTQRYVSAWLFTQLSQTLLTKHHETFWIKAVSEDRGGREFFRYDQVLHTKAPNTSLLVPLLAADKITVDLAAHYEPDGRARDHGMLFKMMPEDLPLLFGEPILYDLTR